MADRKTVEGNLKKLYNDAVEYKMFKAATPTFEEFRHRMMGDGYQKMVFDNYKKAGIDSPNFKDISAFRGAYSLNHTDEAKKAAADKVQGIVDLSKNRQRFTQLSKQKSLESTKKPLKTKVDMSLKVRNPLQNENVIKDPGTGELYTSNGQKFDKDESMYANLAQDAIDQDELYNNFDESKANISDSIFHELGYRPDINGSYDALRSELYSMPINDAAKRVEADVAKLKAQGLTDLDPREASGIFRQQMQMDKYLSTKYKDAYDDYMSGVNSFANEYNKGKWQQYQRQDMMGVLNKYEEDVAKRRMLKERSKQEAIRDRANKRALAKLQQTEKMREQYRREHPFLSIFRDLGKTLLDTRRGISDETRNDLLYTAKETAAAQIANSNIKDIDEALHWRVGDRGVVGRTMRGTVRGLTNTSTYDVAGVSEVLNAESVADAANRWQSGIATPQDEDLLAAFVAQNAIKNDNSDALGGMYGAGVGLAENAQFMASMFVNPLSGIGKASAKKAASQVARWALKKFGKGITSKIAVGVAKYGARAAMDLVGAGFGSEMFGQNRILADAIGRQMGEIKSDGNGGYIIERPKETWSESLYKAHMANAIEWASEMWGEYLPNVGSIGGWLGKMVGKGVNKAFGYDKLLNFFSKYPTTAWAKAFNQFKERTHWDGMIGEYAEEVMGNIANAATVGDMTWDSAPGTGVFNAKVNYDTFLAVALMCGIMSGVNTAGYAAFKYRAGKALDKADSAGINVLGGKWNSYKDRIDNADERQTKTILDEVAKSKDLNDTQKRIIFHYALQLAYYHGANLQDMKNKAEGRDNAQQNAYGEGRAAKGEDKHEAQNDLKAKTAALAQMLNVSEEELSNMTDEQLESLTGEDDETDNAIYDYQTSRARVQGVEDEAQDNADNAASEAETKVDQMTDKNTDTVRPAKIAGAQGEADREVYIVSGDLETHEDGSIDRGSSSDMILYYDPQTGQIEHGDASMFTEVGEARPASEVMDEEANAARQRVLDEHKAEMDGIVQVGSTYHVLGEDGQTHEYKVLSQNADGTVNVSVDGTQITSTLEQLQELRNQSDEARNQAQVNSDVQSDEDIDDEESGADETADETSSDTSDEIAREGDIPQAPEAEVRSSATDETQQEDNMPYDRIVNEQTGQVVPVVVKDEDGNKRFGYAQGAFLFRGKMRGSANDYLGIMVVDQNGKATPYAIKRKYVQVGDAVSKEDYKESRRPVDVPTEESYAPAEDNTDYAPAEETAPAVDNTEVQPSDNTEVAQPAVDETQTNEAQPATEEAQPSAEIQPAPEAQTNTEVEQPTNTTEEAQPTTTEETRPTAEEETQTPATEETQTNTEAQTPAESVTLRDGTQIPLRDGNPAYEQMTPEQGADFYHDEFGDDARQVLEDEVNAAEKALKKAKDSKVKGKNFQEKKASQQAKAEAVKAAQQEYDTKKGFLDNFDNKKYDAKEGRHVVSDEERAQSVAKYTVDDNVADIIMGKGLRKRLQKIADMMGAKLVFLQTADANGWYDSKTNTVYVALDADKALESVFGHEMTHEIKKHNEEAYNKLKEVCKDWLYDNKGDFQSLVLAKRVNYAEQGVVLSQKDAEEEAVADVIGHMINDKNMTKNIAMHLSHPILATIHRVLTEIWDKFGKSSLEAKRFHEMRETIAQAYVETMPREEVEAEEEAQNNGNRFSLRQKPDPSTTKKGYAVFVVKTDKDGKVEKLVPKMLSNDPGAPTGVWLDADTGHLKRDEEGNPLQNSIGRAAVSVNGRQSGGMGSNKLSWRPGKHLALYPNASQFAKKNGMIPSNVVFFEVEYAADEKLHKQYQRDAWSYGTDEKGEYNNTLGGLPYIPEDSYYVYRTNQIADGATPMVITGAYKINRALSDDEARKLNEANGGMWFDREGGDLTEDKMREMGLDEAGLQALSDNFDMSKIAEHNDESKDAMSLPGYTKHDIDWDNKNLRHAMEENGQKVDDYKEGDKFSLRLQSAVDETETNPSDAQKESGNYKKGHVKFGGYDFTIENPKGSYRSGKDADGTEWKQKMNDTYGYIRGKFGKDGDHLDMFINDKADLDDWNGNVYVVDQVNKDGSFDEHKVMYGFDSEEDAKKAYLSNYEEGWQGLGNITGVSKETFDNWLNSSDRKTKPFAEYSSIKNADKFSLRGGMDKIHSLGDVSEESIDVDELPKDYAYRETDVNELEDILENGILREIPLDKPVEGITDEDVTSKRGFVFNFSRPYGRSHGGKGFAKGGLWSHFGGSTAGGDASKVVIGFPGNSAKWRVGYHGRVTSPKDWDEIEHGKALFQRFDEDGYIEDLDVDKMKVWVYDSDGKLHEFKPYSESELNGNKFSLREDESEKRVYSDKASVPTQQELGEGLSEEVKNYAPQAVPWNGGVLYDGQKSPIKYSARGSIMGIGMQPLVDSDGKLRIVDNMGRKFDKEHPISVDDLKRTNSALNAMVDICMSNGTLKDAEVYYQKYADFLNRLLEKGDKGFSNVSDQWMWEGEALYRSVHNNGDEQYAKSIDITRICKKNEAVIHTISELQKRQGYGVTVGQILDIYNQTIEDGYQAPCPVCYVFSRYLRNGVFASTLVAGQRRYGDMLVDPRTLSDKEKKKRVDYWVSELGKLEQFYEENKKAIAQAKLDIQNIFTEVDKLAMDITSGKLKGKELEDAKSRIDELDKRYRAAVDLVSVSDLTGYIKSMAIEKKGGQWQLRNDSWKHYPEDVALDITRAQEAIVEFPGVQRYRNSHGSAAGKSIQTASNNDLGDTMVALGLANPEQRDKRTKQLSHQNLLLKAFADETTNAERTRLLNMARKDVKSATVYAAQQLLRGGIRQWSWSDNIERLSPDVFMNLMQVSMVGGALQAYSKQLEGVELVASMNGYVNGSLMGKGKGYREVDKDYKDAPVYYNERDGKYYTLEFDDVVGIEPFSRNGKLGLFDLNKMYDRAGNILVGMNDIHTRAAMADPRVFFIIPWHSSGMTNHILYQFYNYLGVDTNGLNAQDYTKVQEEKTYGADEAVPQEVTDFWEKHNYGDKYKSGIGEIPSGKGKLSAEQLHYRELKNALLMHNSLILDKPKSEIRSKKDLEDYKFWSEHKDWLEEIKNDEFLSLALDKVQRTVNVHGASMTKGDTEFVYPYEYWDMTAKESEADVNGERYMEYCRRLGMRPKFSGITNNGSVDFGNFCEDPGYWKLLIDRRMYDRNGNFQDLTPVTVDGFNVDMVDPEKTKERFDVTRVAELDKISSVVDHVQSREQERGIVPEVDYGQTLKKAVDKYNKSADNKFSLRGQQMPLSERVGQYDAENGTELERFFSFLERGRKLQNGENHRFHVGNSGEILQQCGIKGDVYVSARAVNPHHHSRDIDHGLTSEEWMDALESMNEPLAITKYGNGGNGFRIYTYAIKNGKSVCLGVDVRTLDNGVEITDVTDIKTAFGRDIEKAIRNEKILYPEGKDRIEKIRRNLAQSSPAPNSQVYEQSSVSGANIGNSSETSKENEEKFSLRDEEYLDAVKNGDMDKAQQMVNEAAKEAGYTVDDSWKMSHRAPNAEDGFSASLDDVSEMMPDIYGKDAYRYYGSGIMGGYESIAEIQRVHGKPNAKVMVYRAVPNDVKEGSLRNGDWVSLSRDYAKMHGESNINGGYKIIKEEVPAKHLYFDGNSVSELGYDDGKGYAYKNTKNNRKSLDAVTYDDNGNVIPLSKRFNQRNADTRFSLRLSTESEEDSHKQKMRDFIRVYKKALDEEYYFPDYAHDAIVRAKDRMEKDLRESCDNDPVKFLSGLGREKYEEYLSLLPDYYYNKLDYSEIGLEDSVDDEEDLYRGMMDVLPAYLLTKPEYVEKYIPSNVIEAMLPKNPKLKKMMPIDYSNEVFSLIERVTGLSHEEVVNTYGVDDAPQMLTDEDFNAAMSKEDDAQIVDHNKFSLREVNDRFNEQLSELTEENADKEILSVGYPSDLLRSVGIPNRDIRLYGNKIMKKAKAHSYLPTDLKDLPTAIQNPIAIFEGSYKGSYSILTELPLNGENALASVDVNKGEVQDINLITSVYGKRGDSVLSWIKNGKLLYADKKRTLDYISSSAPIADATHKQEFSTAAKIVKDFENPSISEENKSSSQRFSLRQSYDDRLSNWKKRNGLAPDEQPMDKPQRLPNESIGDYMVRMANYAKNQALWKTAPRPSGYMEALEKWKQDNGIPADEYRPSIPRKADYATEAEYIQARDKYKQEMDKWKGAPKASDYDLSVDLDSMQSKLAAINAAMINQRSFDRQTIDGITEMVKTMLALGWGDNMTRGKIGNLLVQLKKMNGNTNAREVVSDTMSLLADNYIRNLEAAYKKMTSNKGVRKDATGVIKIGSLDAEGQALVDEHNKVLTMADKDVDDRESELLDAIANGTMDANLANARLEGIRLARIFRSTISTNAADIDTLKQQISTLDAKKNKTKAERELLLSLKMSLTNAKIERAKMYLDMLGEMGGRVSDSKEGARKFRERMKNHRKQILDLARQDMGDKDATEMSTDNFWKKFLRNPILRTIMSPTATFEQMLKFFGMRTNVNGEGGLYNYFIPKWHEAADTQQVYNERNQSALDQKVKELFPQRLWTQLLLNGHKDMKISFIDLIGKESKAFPGMDIEVNDLGNTTDPKLPAKRKIHLKQGQMLYIYLVNKEVDGAMKLRAMGITEQDVADIEYRLNGQLKALGDWLQQEYLPECQRRYQETHIKYFGAPMADVENYFPLVINPNARHQSMDVGNQNSGNTQLSGTTTGAIVTRRVNVTPLDIENADALAVAWSHLQEMEEWSAMLPFRQDVNTLLSSKNFRNQVKNISSIAYGNGEDLWKRFVAVSQIAAGTYEANTFSKEFDKTVQKAIGLVSMAKISGRLWTAAKQTLSFPAFLPEVGVIGLPLYLKNFVTFPLTYIWARKNMPLFRKRVDSLSAGDPRIIAAMDAFDKKKNFFVKIGQMGMFPNVYIDAFTCAVGAKTVYDVWKSKYIRLGYPEAKAEEKALLKASLSYNKSQQSSENAFVSTMQVDRTYLASALSLFKNSNYAYGRSLIEAARGLANSWQFWGGKHKRAMISSMTAQIQAEEGFDEDVARGIAKNAYNNAIFHNLAVLATYGALLPILWQLGSNALYLILGDDDDKKKHMLEEAAAKGLATSVTDDYAIPFVSNYLNAGIYSDEDGVHFGFDSMKNQNLYVNPTKSDIANILNSMAYGNFTEAEYQSSLLIAQAFMGLNPATLGSVIQSFIEKKENADGSKKNSIQLAEVLNAPESNIRDLYMDELGLNGNGGNGATIDEVSNRYGKRQVLKNQGILEAAPWNDVDAAIKKYQDRFEKRIQEYIDNLEAKDPAKMKAVFNSTTDPKMKAMIAKSEEKKAKEGMSELKKPKAEKPAHEQLYESMRTYDDMIDDVALRSKNQRLRTKFAGMTNEYNKLNSTNQMKATRFLNENKTFKQFKKLMSDNTSIGKEITELKKKMVNSDSTKRAEIMDKIRKLRKKYMDEQSKVR